MDSFKIAASYIARGWAVFPLKSRSKEPATLTGFTEATKDSAILAAQWAGRKGLNIGIATGQISGIVVVDIDGEEGANNLRELEEQNGQLPSTLASITQKGRHYIFAAPDGLRVPCSVGKLAPGIDIRGDGGYIVAPNSTHPDGHIYHWADSAVPIAPLPEWVATAACRKKEAIAHSYTDHKPYTDTWDTTDVQAMLAVLDPDMQYDEWLHVGMALHHGGYSLGMWDGWSRQGSKYEVNCCFKRWQGFGRNTGITMGTLVDMAKARGWHPAPLASAIGLEAHPAKLFVDAILAPVSASGQLAAPDTLLPSTTFTAPIDPMALPGIIGDTVRWIVASAIKPQPELALFNTLAALGAVFGRRYSSPYNTRTNLYIVGIAGTGSGKDHSRKCVKTLLALAGLDIYLGADSIVSGAGLLQSLSVKPAQIMHLDEFGMLMQAITDQNGPAYLRVTGKIMTELYSSSGSIYNAGQYADEKKKAVTINSPNLCIYGTTTLEKYADALTQAAVLSGELNRFIVLPVSKDRPERQRSPAEFAPPTGLVDAWKSLRAAPGDLASVNSGAIAPEPTSIEWGALKGIVYDLGLFEDEKHAQDGYLGALWNRYTENIIKLCMILAITDNPAAPSITESHIAVATALVKASAEYMETMALQHMSRNQIERESKEIERFISRSKKGVSRSDLLRNFRNINKKQMDDVINSLIDIGIVNAESRPASGGVGRHATFYTDIGKHGK